MDIVKHMGRFFGGFCVVVAAAGALTGCAAEEADGEDIGDSEDAVNGKNPTYQYVQVGTLAHRRVSLSGGKVSISTNAPLYVGQQVADFGALVSASKASDIDDKLVLWKLSGKLGRYDAWKKDVTAANADIKAIRSALDAAASNGCVGSDWHLATFNGDGADFVCGTLTTGKTLGKTKPGGGTGTGESFCDLKAKYSASRSGDTVTLTFTRNGVDETVGGQWYSADGTPWEGADSSDLYRCPSSKCSIVPTKLTASRPSVTFTATRIQGRKVRFISTGGACVYGPY
jgi:hypothetical protein